MFAVKRLSAVVGVAFTRRGVAGAAQFAAVPLSHRGGAVKRRQAPSCRPMNALRAAKPVQSDERIRHRVQGIQAQKWPARPARRRSPRADLFDLRDLQCRLARREARPDRICPSVRAYVVSRLGKRRQRRALHSNSKQRRQRQRHDQQRAHQLLRNLAGQSVGAGRFFSKPTACARRASLKRISITSG